MGDSDQKPTTQDHVGSSTQSSLIPPKKIQDDEPKRATFGVRYPRDPGADLVLATKEDIAKLPAPQANEEKTTISARRVSIRARLRTFSKLLFRECNFHNTKGRTASRVKNVTFEHCDFERTFMGTTIFHRVRFRDCTFEYCDFSNAEFYECVFERCRFKTCSAESAIFTKTEIDSTEFLGGIEFPQYNLKGKSPEYTMRLRRFWTEVRLRLAEQLFRSNSEINHSEYSDKALLALKRAQLIFRRDLWQHRSPEHSAVKQGLSAAVFSNPAEAIRLFLSWANIFLTRGGTSLQNLVIVLIALTVVYPAFLIGTNVKINGAQALVSLESVSAFLTSYGKLFFSAASLLLGFGFGSFTAESLSGVAVSVLGSTFGVFWYSLLIPVIIRKIYR